MSNNVFTRRKVLGGITLAAVAGLARDAGAATATLTSDQIKGLITERIERAEGTVRQVLNSVIFGENGRYGLQQYSEGVKQRMREEEGRRSDAIAGYTGSKQNEMNVYSQQLTNATQRIMNIIRAKVNGGVNIAEAKLFADAEVKAVLTSVGVSLVSGPIAGSVGSVVLVVIGGQVQVGIATLEAGRQVSNAEIDALQGTVSDQISTTSQQGVRDAGQRSDDARKALAKVTSVTTAINGVFDKTFRGAMPSFAMQKCGPSGTETAQPAGQPSTQQPSAQQTAQPGWCGLDIPGVAKSYDKAVGDINTYVNGKYVNGKFDELRRLNGKLNPSSSDLATVNSTADNIVADVRDNLSKQDSSARKAMDDASDTALQIYDAIESGARSAGDGLVSASKVAMVRAMGPVLELIGVKLQNEKNLTRQKGLKA